MELLSDAQDVFKRNVNPVLDDVPAYVPGPTAATIAAAIGMAPEHLVKLSSNEAPLGPSPAVRQALRDIAAGDELHRYPSPDMSDLREAIAANVDLDPEQILLSDGSSETWPVIIRAFSQLGDGVLAIEPSLRSYQQIAVVQERTPQVVRVDSPFAVEAGTVLAGVTDRTRIVFISTPNNTTSLALSLDSLREIAAEASDAIVVVDEHYIEAVPNYKQRTAIQLLGEVPNLIVTRTFSKMYGLAGLRVGYAAAPPDAVAMLRRARSLWAVSLPAKVTAMAAIGDEEHLRRNIETTAAGRSQLLADLSAWPVVEIVKEPEGGFILFRVEGRPGDEVASGLLQDGVMVRADLAEGFVRVSVGTQGQNARFMATLGRVISGRQHDG